MEIWVWATDAKDDAEAGAERYKWVRYLLCGHIKEIKDVNTIILKIM